MDWLEAHVRREMRGITPSEEQFRSYVNDHAHIGYGRMMQIIEEEWVKRDPKGAPHVTLTPQDPKSGNP